MRLQTQPVGCRYLDSIAKSHEPDIKIRPEILGILQNFVRANRIQFVKSIKDQNIYVHGITIQICRALLRTTNTIAAQLMCSPTARLNHCAGAFLAI